MKLGDDFIAPYHRPGKVNILVMEGETGPLWKISDLDYTMSASIDKCLIKSPEDRTGRIADRAPGA